MIDLRLTIVGIGLMGGSLAKALRGQVAHLTAVDEQPATRQQALAENVVDMATDDLGEGISRADLVILATPVGAILEQLRQLPQLRPDGCLVLDLGSVKGAITSRMDWLPSQFAAIGGHPMCGKEWSGYAASEAKMYAGKPFILARNRRTTREIESLALDLVRAIGARPIFLDALEHDRLTAAISHLPYLLSSLLMRQAGSENDDRLWQISASGFRDSSRLAGSDPRMMRDILTNNREAVLAQLDQYRHALDEITSLLAKGDDETLVSWLSDAQRLYLHYRRAVEDDNA